MTTFNTGNPIGSTDARDRLDNSENLDLAVNSLEQTFVDRLGRTRDTLEGVYQKSAYYRVGTFEDGYTLTNNRQTLSYGNVEYSWSGVFPKTVNAGSTPATSGGIGAGAWVDRTQDTLRGDIASGSVSFIGVIHPEKYGAIANASGVAGVGVDSTQAFIAAAQECLSTGKTLKATGKYRITGDIDLRYICLDMANASVFIDSATSKVKLGGNASNANNPEQRFGGCSRVGGANTVPDIRLSGVKGQNIHIEYSEYTLVWASTTLGVRDQEYSCAYSNIHLKRCIKLELNTDPLNALGAENSDVGGSMQWINECNFYLNRTTTLIVDGSYNHNHNRFYCGTFEGNSVISFNKGRDNRMYGERFEGLDATVTFGVGTERNVIINSFDDSEFNGGPDVATTSVIDNGSQNIVADDFRLYYKTETVASADISNVVLSNEVGDITSRQPYLQCVQGSVGGALLLSEYLLAQYHDYIFWNTHAYDSGDSVLYRPFITFYDKNLNRLTPNTAWIFSPTITVINGNDIQTGTGTSGGRGRITQQAFSDGVMFIKVGWKASNGQLANGLARKLTIISATKENHSTTPLNVNKTQVNHVVSAIPTKGFAPLGYSAMKSDMTARYLNKFSLSTTITSVTSASLITLTTATGIAVGDVVGVNLSDRTTHWTTVSAISGSDASLTVATPILPQIGSRVVFNRWSTEAI